MADDLNEITKTTVRSQKQSIDLMEKLFTVAQPGVVFGEPVNAGDYTVFTASEVSVCMGFGFGMGGGSGPTNAHAPAQLEAEGQQKGTGMGGGGGGGGLAAGRPVAVISVGPNGVQVTPIVDRAKIALAALTTAGAMAFMLTRMFKNPKR